MNLLAVLNAIGALVIAFFVVALGCAVPRENGRAPRLMISGMVVGIVALAGWIAAVCLADWRTYENEMINTLTTHPSLANDPDTLYRMSVPPEVLEARATARALEKLKGGTDSSVVPGARRATAETSTKPTGINNFNDAVAFAKSQLKQQGLKPVGG